MARQTNGTTQFLNSAAAIDLGSTSLVSVQAWLWWDTNANDDHLAMEYGVAAETDDGFRWNPNQSATTRWQMFMQDTSGGNQEARSFTRPSAAAWHHIVTAVDWTQVGGSQITAIWVDGSSQSLTTDLSQNGTFFAANKTLYLMSRAGTSLFAAGRIAEVAIWKGVILSGGEVATLYGNGPLGESSTAALANTVQSGSLAYYWRLLGNASPEPATVGGIDMTVGGGATQVSHPIATGSGGATALAEDGLSFQRINTMRRITV